MATVGKRVTVAVTPTKLNSASSGPGDPTVGSSLTVRNRDASASVYLGGSTVATGTGFELLAGESLPMDVGRGEDVYAICAASTVVCHVLEVGV
jgi:hypothetical protein